MSKKSSSNAKSRNLYKFIRSRLGNDISDREITRRWKMDIKNFMGIKHGTLPPPRLERIKQLADVLDVSKYVLFEIAMGASPQNAKKLVQAEYKKLKN